MRGLVLAVGIVVGAIVLGSLLVDEGEVVTLVTRDAEGLDHDTQLWVAQWQGGTWIRASSPENHWLERLRAHPDVTLRRGEQVLRYHAVPVPEPAVRAGVDAAMAEKYGLADRLWAKLGDRSRAVPIRLEPVDAAAGSGRSQDPATGAAGSQEAAARPAGP